MLGEYMLAAPSAQLQRSVQVLESREQHHVIERRIRHVTPTSASTSTP